MTPKTDIAAEAVKAAPPWVLYWITGDGALKALGIIYLLLQVAYLGWKWGHEHADRKRALQRLKGDKDA